MKECFKCHETKMLTEFYKHPRMSDGHLGKCKECAKKDAHRWRRESEHPREYDRKRYHQNPARRAHTAKVAAAWAAKYPERRKAQNAIHNAIRDGRLIKADECKTCGSTGRLHGHHDDYSKPLDVRWLCVPCHARHHMAVDGHLGTAR